MKLKLYLAKMVLLVAFCAIFSCQASNMEELNRDPKLSQYRYTFKQPGTYKIVFEGINTTIENTQKAVKEMTITITE